DGIRDFHVTGVQTCALPISLLRTLQDALDLTRAEAGELDLSLAPAPLRAVMDDIQADWAPRAARDNVALMVGYEGDTELAAVIEIGRASCRERVERCEGGVV